MKMRTVGDFARMPKQGFDFLPHFPHSTARATKLYFSSFSDFFFADEEFFLFLVLSLVLLMSMHFFHMLQTLKLNSKNQKTKKNKVCYDWLLQPIL